MNLNLRELILWNNLILFSLLLFTSEILSFFNLINETSVRLLWFIIFIFYLIIIKKIKNKYLLDLKKITFNLETLIIISIVISTFIISILYPPNTPDFMSYHMTRVLNWVQNSNINFYPTNDLRELVLGPLPPIFNLHLFLIFNGDYFANLVQWYSMLVTLVTVSLIASEFRLSSKYRIFTIIFCITLPMGILQSTSTQTDYVATMWLVSLVYFLIKFINNKKYIFGIGFAISLGFGILTKGTVYFFSFPFCLWFAYIIFKNLKQNWKLVFIIPFIVIFLNGSHFIRNIEFANNPLGITKSSNSWVNNNINVKSVSSNILRNFGSSLALPNHNFNLFVIDKIKNLHDILQISTDEKETSMEGSTEFTVFFSLYESYASNPLHLIILTYLLIFLLIKSKLDQNHKNYLYCIFGSFLFFCIFIKWSIWNNRHLLSLFILASPLVGYSLQKLQINKTLKILTVILFLYSLPYVLFNKSRPLLASINNENNRITIKKPYFFSNKRYDLYYTAFNFKKIKSAHINMSEVLKKINCRKIGSIFSSAGNPLTYPFWILMKNKFEGNDINIVNLKIENYSKNFNNQNLNYDELCAIIDFNKLSIKVID